MTLILAALVSLAAFLSGPRVQRVDPGTQRSRRRNIVALGLMPVLAVLAIVRLDQSPLLAFVAVGAGAAVLRAVRRRGRRREAERRRERVVSTCEGLAADLAAGLAPVPALRNMATDWIELRPVLHAAEVGADVPRAFRSTAMLPGAGMLQVAASAWSVAHRSGAGLGPTVALAADAVRSERAMARVVAGELAAARATARLLTLLPAGILLLGRGVGGDPLGFLLKSLPGQTCLVAGSALLWCGSIWLERIADEAESQ